MGLTIALVVGLILSLPVMLLWNYFLVDAITGVKEIGWMQAWGILVLCGLLFKTNGVTEKTE
jgi:hypothetical protein